MWKKTVCDELAFLTKSCFGENTSRKSQIQAGPLYVAKKILPKSLLNGRNEDSIGLTRLLQITVYKWRQDGGEGR